MVRFLTCLLIILFSLFCVGTPVFAMNAQVGEISAEDRQPAVVRPGYERFELENCDVHISQSQRSKVPKALFQRVVSDLNEIRQWLNVEPLRRPKIYIEYGRSALLSVLEHLQLKEVPSWVPALALPGKSIAVIDLEYMIRNPGRGLTTLRHEMVHLVLGETGVPLPRWVHEGLAQSIARQIPDPSKSREVALFARRGGLVPIHEIDQYLPKSHDRATTLYAVSVLFIEWTRKTYGEDFHAKVLDHCGKDVTWSEAFEKEAGISPSVAFDRWQNSFGSQVLWPGLLLDILISWKSIAFLVIVAAIVQSSRRRRALERMRQQEELEDTSLWQSQKFPTSDGPNTKD
ncbi:hypothetical protein CBD41_07660 [bacterium TMED181]|nr:hypothetical protein [Planctomycetota bacterium]OUW43155.1 MAG: hypothetical protein CBD41_07660 [bacterium TMED181]